MKMKHFTFDLDYFPIKNSNVFQQIKIDKNKDTNSGKQQVKRFPMKNQPNLQQIPDIMFFQKSIKKPKIQIQPEIFSPISNKTKRSHNFSVDQLEWSFIRRADQKLETQRKVESCPKPTLKTQKIENSSFLRNSLKPSNFSERQQKSQKVPFLHEFPKKYQLQSLEQCQSEFDQSSKITPLSSKNKNINLVEGVFIISESKKKKNLNGEKHNKSKKTQKSYSSKNNNPEIVSNKEKMNKKKSLIFQEKEQIKTANPLKNEDPIKSKNKFISLTRKSYYLIGSKNTKNRSLNKEKKTKKNNSLREDGIIILSNGDISEHSLTGPSNCRNSSLSNSTANSKVKVESSKSKRQTAEKRKKRTNFDNQQQFSEIIKRTGQILDKYKDQCILLKRQKEQYQEKYEQALKKLNRIKEEIEFVMKTE